MPAVPGTGACAYEEVEVNDTAATANEVPAVSGAFCGKLPSTADVDYLTFMLPADAKTISFGESWNKAVIQAEVNVDGSTFLVGNTPVLKPGARYVVKVWIKGPGAATDYTLNIGITK